MFSKRIISTIVLLLLAVSTCAAQRPNVVLILADDLGYGDLSSFGAPDLKTPNLDAIGAEGMVFTRFYANSPVCSPTRAALLSGRYPDVVGVPGVIRTMERDSWGYLHPDALLLPQVLKGEGYHTALIGKWHLGLEPPNVPGDRGFDEFRGWLGDMMDDYWSHRRHGLNYMRRNSEPIEAEGHATDLFTEWAVDYVEERAPEEPPFFLLLAYNAPHFPVQPPQEWVDRVMAREPGIPEKRAKLVAFIEHMDAGVGRVMEAVRRSGEMENTLVIFTSDNGGLLADSARNGPFRGGKQEMYEGGIRVPALISWPRRVVPGSRSDTPLMAMDLYPTIARAAGAVIRHRIDGLNFLDELEGGSVDVSDRSMIFVRREGNDRYVGLAYYAVQKGGWKLLQNEPTRPFELYNLAEDPGETTDLIEERRDVYEDLAEELRLHILAAGAVPWRRQ